VYKDSDIPKVLLYIYSSFAVKKNYTLFLTKSPIINNNYYIQVSIGTVLILSIVVVKNKTLTGRKSTRNNTLTN